MRWVVPVNVPSRAKILKLYEEGPFKSPSTGRPWPGSLQTILGAPGSLKHVQPAFISVAGLSPSAVAVLTAPSDAAKAARTTMHLRIRSSLVAATPSAIITGCDRRHKVFANRVHPATAHSFVAAADPLHVGLERPAQQAGGSLPSRTF